ncbi:MAG: YdcH family protein [Rhodoferax sp.]
MFPEYGNLIAQLKKTDPHFNALLEQHHTLDLKVINIESHIEPGTHEEIEILKKEKLRIKDQIYTILRKASA